MMKGNIMNITTELTYLAGNIKPADDEGFIIGRLKTGYPFLAEFVTDSNDVYLAMDPFDDQSIEWEDAGVECYAIIYIDEAFPARLMLDQTN